MLKLSIENGAFKDSFGREVILRGINFAADAKLPAKPFVPSHAPENDAFFDGDNVSFVGSPCSLEELDAHLERLKSWGFNTIRYIFTWEALEHDGPGIYDEEFIDFTIKVLYRLKHYQFYVIMDPHQDCWSRFCGGSGAPLWTHYAVGLNPRNFKVTQAALLESHFLDNPKEKPKMVWASNYTRLAASTLFTLFFAGKTFAPKCVINGVNIQDFLESHFINAVSRLAERVHSDTTEPGGLEKCIIGWESINEPGHGYIGVEDLDEVPKSQQVKLYTVPTGANGMALGYGFEQTMPKFEFGLMGPKVVNSKFTVNPKGVKAWLSPEETAHFDKHYGWERAESWVAGDQLATLKQEGIDAFGAEVPCLITEIGVPYDMDDKQAFSTGDFSSQIRSMDANNHALEFARLSHTLWVYVTRNNNKFGDNWNGEDLSIWSNDAVRSKSTHSADNLDDLTLAPVPENCASANQADYSKFHCPKNFLEGARAPEAFIRPVPSRSLNQPGGHVAEILLHPVKSMGSVSVMEAEIDAYGFKYDRIYMLAQRDWTDKIDKDAVKETSDSNNGGGDIKVRVKDFITQRENPQMTLIQPTLDVERNELTLTYTPDPAHKLVLPLDMARYIKDHPGTEATLPVVQTIIWGTFVNAYDLQSLARYYYNQGAAAAPDTDDEKKIAAAEWELITTETPVTDFFTDVVRVVLPAILLWPETRRRVTPEKNGPTEASHALELSFQDGYPGNLVSLKSLADLSTRVNRDREADDQVPLLARNFRPNLVLADTLAAWDEDDWKHITITPAADSKGQHRSPDKSRQVSQWHVACRNVRCQVPTISLTTGTFHPNREPYKTMQKFRRIDKGAPYEPCFGMNLVNESFGFTVAVGDLVTVNRRGPHFYVP
ncbi:hypothetical protein D0Z00_000113 [Geotrichum galactomycetum]|uniref:Uncharacterized protein n=1 Tax=Geotrichum galactomycetum TaxID=27317 RepID=A0ACB6VAZ4_9ASCO|nr:hypothetical protein D0Z00_000113 [Geotrichum candidum]